MTIAEVVAEAGCIVMEQEARDTLVRLTAETERQDCTRLLRGMMAKKDGAYDDSYSLRKAYLDGLDDAAEAIESR